MERYFPLLGDRQAAVTAFYNEHLGLINRSKGSQANHQAWVGGYRDHITQCFQLAEGLYKMLDVLPFGMDSVVIVLYFHDVEKVWRYSCGLPGGFDKDEFYRVTLPDKWKIKFTPEELNALKYIHGEGTQYRGDRRTMNELAGFCHAVDTLSARTLWDQKPCH